MKFTLFKLFTSLWMSMLVCQAQNQCIYRPKQEKQLSEEEKSSLLQKLKATRASGLTTLPVQLHFVVNSQGGKQDLESLKTQFVELNQKFLPLNIQFSICGDVHYIFSDEWDQLTTLEEQLNIGLQYDGPATIDVFFVSYIEGASGYYTNASSTDGFLVIQNNLSKPETLIHEFGHFFGLPHTHDTGYGIERVDGSNCTIAGDKFCDTPADPLLGYGNVNSSTCMYQGTEKDPIGQSYKPDVANFMSYAPFGCRNKFSQNQYDAMLLRYASTLSQIGYLCANKPDYTAKIKTITKLEKGVTTQLPIEIINYSNYNYSNASLAYTISITGSNQQKTILSKGTVLANVGPNYAATLNFSVTVPIDQADDTYRLSIELDPDNVVSELNENNNSSSQEVGIYSNGIPKADLSISATGAGTVYAGHNYAFSVELKNIGNLTATKSIYRVYRSDDTLVDGSDIELHGGDYASVPPDKVYNNDVSLVISSLVGKTYYIIVTVDVEEAGIESSKKNNYSILKVTTIAPPSGIAKADYMFGTVSMTTSNPVKRLRRVGVSTIVKNVGTEKNYNLSLASYYSKDNVLDAQDTKLWSQIQRFYNSSEEQLYFMANVPKTASLGNGYILYVLDDLKQIDESNENNNVYALAITVEAESEPQLEFLSYDQGPSYWQFGKTITVKGAMVNTGNQTCNPPFVEFYLLKDKSLFQYYYFYGIWLNNMINTNTYLPPNASMEFTYNKEVLDTELNPGVYDLVGCLHYSANNEERVNCMAFPQRVTIGYGTITDLNESNTNDQSTYVFPNPSTGMVYVQNIRPDFSVKIYAANGSFVKSIHFDNPTGSMDLSNLYKGIYFMKIEDHLGVSTKLIHLE